MRLTVFFQPSAVGVTGILSESLVWQICGWFYRAKNTLKLNGYERIVLQSSIFEGRKAFEQIRPLFLLPVQGLYWHCELRLLLVF